MGEAPMFIPPVRDEYWAVVRERYTAARAEASRIKSKTNVDMRVEILKPVHLGLTEYRLPVGTKTYTLKDNTAIFPFGIINRDEGFDYMKWWSGAQLKYIADWFVAPVYLMSQYKQGVYGGNLKAYEFRGAETFTFQVHTTTTPTPSEVDAWLLAFVVLPETMAETAIVEST